MFMSLIFLGVVVFCFSYSFILLISLLFSLLLSSLFKYYFYSSEKNFFIPFTKGTKIHLVNISS